MLGHNQMTLNPYDKSTHPSNILFLKTTQGEKKNQHTVKKAVYKAAYFYFFILFLKKKCIFRICSLCLLFTRHCLGTGESAVNQKSLSSWSLHFRRWLANSMEQDGALLYSTPVSTCRKSHFNPAKVSTHLANHGSLPLRLFSWQCFFLLSLEWWRETMALSIL